jgi:pteridine reductase
LEITGKTALVTGSGRRVGRALAFALAEAGARVAVHYNGSQADAAETVEAIRDLGGEAEALQADLEAPEAAYALVRAALDRFGSLDILVNNASLFATGRFEDTSVTEWDRYMAVNVRAPFLLAQAMAAALPSGSPGKIINLNDWRTARAKRFAYGASKAALSGLTRSLAVSMAPDVQVNELALGAVLPPADITPRPLEQMETKLGPSGRMGTLNEVAQAMLALIGNDFITGETLHIDGGRHID